MANKIYQLIFDGEIVDNYNIEDVKKNLYSLFKGDVKNLEQLFTGRTIVIKKQLDHQKVVRYQKAFLEAGIIVRIEPRGTQDPSKSSEVVERQEASERTETIICPKCGFEQKQSDECIRCGLIIKKYQEEPGEESIMHIDSDTSVLTPGQIQRKNIATIVLLTGIVLLLAALFQKDRLPDADDILPEVYQMPRQTQTSALAFKTEVGKKVYTITPLYDYELYGLVVSYYDSTGWWDITHKFLWKDFINIKDICILYGFNVRTDAYKDMRFKSGTWTCYVKLPTERAQVQFHDICLSNNHLLSDSKTLAKEIMRAKRGDQIYLKGYLSAYSHSGGSFFRGSSTTRTDKGDGACETIYLTAFRIIKKSNVIWRILFSLSVFLVAGSIFMLILYYGKEFFGYSRKKASPGIFRSNDAYKKVKLGVILKLLFLLFLIYLWARLH